ncbi:MAG TPA: hypothetical protein VGJ21_07710 [Terracidiphilus sp.]|jgi:hypothetical protein
MRLRTVVTPLVLATLTLVTGSALLQAQAPDTQSNKKIYGYQDPQTGQFHAMAMEGPTEGASTTLAGVFKVVLNITVKSTWPAGATHQIVCSSEFEQTSVTTSASFSMPYIEEASRYATAATGGGFTCTMLIPYSWLIPTTAVQKTLTGSYSVGVQNTATTAPPILRLSSGPIVSTPTLPANGVTTAYSIAVTI